LAFFTQAGTWSSHVSEDSDLISQIKNGTLPQVSFVMPDSDADSDQAPGSLAAGQQWVKTVVDDLNSSGYLGSTVVLLTWDDSGGWYDHVVPPGSFGYRVPMIMLAPYGSRGVVDHSVASHYSVPTVIESVFGLGCMHLDCGAYDLLDALSSQGARTTTTGSSPAGTTSSTTSPGLTLSSSSSVATTSEASATTSASTTSHTTTSRSTTTSTGPACHRGATPRRRSRQRP
ncbi:MAG: alkaline phosphatase family protein, partial [Nitrososphaerales archaeon]